ncbi:hypothetical protein CesoFtcFv8_013426 [Champsocephalus esox]|uniref:Uncharacterized protein n=1 Tax=Champsocephalus esox TaxID=159716 RepID=A0AAN8BQS9_9TELE|nr:hypothetical protein CesoFtcFv8_013426 [Champsocephalus esox]
MCTQEENVPVRKRWEAEGHSRGSFRPSSHYKVNYLQRSWIRLTAAEGRFSEAELHLSVKSEGRGYSRALNV